MLLLEYRMIAYRVEQYSFAKNNKTVFKQNNFIKLCQSSTQGRLPEQEWHTMSRFFSQDFQEHRVEQGHEQVFVKSWYTNLPFIMAAPLPGLLFKDLKHIETKVVLSG